MSYPFVQAFHDLGPRKGPVAGVNVHMAEGGGTVGFLAHRNGDGVSVHYVIEYSGRIVQMLREDHMQSAIRIRKTDGSYAIRQDQDGMWGHKVAVAVLGAWADTHTTLGPNHATIGVEIEGFAAHGPNAAQQDSLAHLVADCRTRHPKIGTTGHRDHNVKGCPGSFIQWNRLGGHGPYTSLPLPVPQPAPEAAVAIKGNLTPEVPTRVHLKPDPLDATKSRWLYLWSDHRPDAGNTQLKPNRALLLTRFIDADTYAVAYEPAAGDANTTSQEYFVHVEDIAKTEAIIPPVVDTAAIAKAARDGALESARTAAIKGAGDAIDALPR